LQSYGLVNFGKDDFTEGEPSSKIQSFKCHLDAEFG